MVKFTKKHKSHIKTPKVKNVNFKVKKEVSVPRKIWTDLKNDEVTMPLKTDEVTVSVSALLQAIKKGKEDNKSNLFKDDSEAVMLQVLSFKVPETTKMQVRIPLPHSLAIESAEVCLITPDVKGSTKDNHEITISHYQNLLKKHGIEKKIQIVPLRQLKSEHTTFETKGRFASLYDLYLVEGSLLGYVTKLVGSRFFKKHNLLVPVRLNKSNFKREVLKALGTTSLRIHGHGDSSSVQVGYSHFSTEQIVENVCAAAKVLCQSFPGGFPNIRKLFVKTPSSMAIPVYVSLGRANDVAVPVVAPRLPKAAVPVEGELTTLLGAHVRVMPTGEVAVRKVVTREDREMGFGPPATQRANEESSEEEEEEEEEDDDEDEEDEVVPKAADKMVKGRSDGDEEDEDEDEDDEDEDEDEDDEDEDEDVETAEDVYMKTLQDLPKQQSVKKNDKKQGKNAQLPSVKTINNKQSKREVNLKKVSKQKKNKKPQSSLVTPTTGASRQSAMSANKKPKGSQPSPAKIKMVKLQENENSMTVKMATPKSVGSSGKKATKLKGTTPGKMTGKTDTPSNKKAKRMSGSMDKAATPSNKQTKGLKSEGTLMSAGRYFSPDNVKNLAEEGTPVTRRSMVGKKQTKKSRLSLVVGEEKADISSPKRRMSGVTPRPEKMEANSSRTLSNNVVQSPKVQSAKKNKRKSVVLGEVTSNGGSPPKRQAKQNQK